MCDFNRFSNTACSDNHIFQLYECTKDVSCHLRLLQCSERNPGQYGKYLDVPEAILLLYRVGIFSVDSSTCTLTLKICENHRANFGLQWRRMKTKCCHPDHNAQSKAKPDRGATPTLCKDYWLRTRQTIVV